MTVEHAVFSPEVVKTLKLETAEGKERLAEAVLEYTETEMARRIPLGEGKAGKVWVSDEKFFAQQACVKTIHNPDVSFNDLRKEFEMQQQFLEAGIPVPHPFCYVQGNGRTEARYGLMAMGRIHGETLERRLEEMHRRKETMTPKEFNELRDTLADIIKSMHRAHLYHRDLHLRNVMIDESNRLQIIDFGDARQSIGDEEERDAYRSDVVRDGKMITLVYPRDEDALGKLSQTVRELHLLQKYETAPSLDSHAAP
ncbi:MAG: phosphotransferase [Candidatus Kerfeldbacteria bacterium]|nr:phosphotransferase [Candidatus Kerfeldbacteria bacterium]